MRDRWETWARLDLGDHGMGARRDDPARVGLIELTDSLRWVPRDREGWAVPISELTVTTPKTWLNRPADGVEVRHRQLGTFRIRALSHRDGTPLAPSQAYLGQAARSGRLLKELLRRGAVHEPA